MMNEHSIDGEILYIHITKKTGEKVTAIMDLEDMDKAAGYRWIAGRQADTFRIVCHRWIDGKKRAVYLHRIVTGAPEGKLVDHINCNPLDNRKVNLRFLDTKSNSQNKKRPPVNNTSGVIGVTLHSTRGYYQVSLTVDGKTVYGGQSRNLEVAKGKAETLRAKHMPFSQEAMHAVM